MKLSARQFSSAGSVMCNTCSMEIWVDADACPGAIKEILFRAAQRTGMQLTLVANHSLQVPPNANIRMLQVSSGFDVADDEIVKLANGAPEYARLHGYHALQRHAVRRPSSAGTKGQAGICQPTGPPVSGAALTMRAMC